VRLFSKSAVFAIFPLKMPLKITVTGLLQQKKGGVGGVPPPTVKTKETDTKRKKKGGLGGSPPQGEKKEFITGLEQEKRDF
jgi:hypothetical protein